MKKYNFPCGCSFDVVSDEGEDIRIQFDPKIVFEEDDRLTCKRTWDYISSGQTKGVFQLESPLGRSLSKKLAPENIEQLSALISIMRPGCMESIMDGKSVTQHYIDRKHLREEVHYYHPSLIPALKSTYGLLVYQEQAMQIVRDIAGFNLQEADALRKAIGKKNPEEMAKIKTMFLEKAKVLNIVSEQEAEEIFSWIEKSQRYSFNKSHAVSYAYNGYLSAYCKAHFTRPFFASYLYYSQQKAKQTTEIRELVNDAKAANIDVTTPDFRRIITKSLIAGLNPSLHFMIRDKTIYLGFTDIKGVGEIAITKFINKIPEIELRVKAKYDKWTWTDFLLFATPHLTNPVVKAMIQTGCLSHFNISRTEMLYEYDILDKLSSKELDGVQKLAKDMIYCLDPGGNVDTRLVELLKMAVYIGPGRDKVVSNKNRIEILKDIIKTLENPPYSLEDSPDWISGIEESLMGISLTCTKVDGRDISSANCTCQEFRQGKNGFIIIGAQVTNVNEIKTKSGKNPGRKMAFITIGDTSGSLDNVVAFPEEWDEFKGLLVSGNLVLVGGEKGKDNSLILKKVWQI